MMRIRGESMRGTRAWLVSSGIAAALALGGCAETKLAATGVKSVQRAGEEGAPRGAYKVGDAYQINGVWYTPAEDWRYEETGLASFYGGEKSGTNFHGRNTANGESYDMNALTAAHRTLPMPSLVRVTNLENGREIVLRVNDRGPFAQGRILDVSRRSAQLLGFEQAGTARVRVQILPEESQQLKAALLRGGPAPGIETVAAAPRTAVASDALPPPPGARSSNVQPATLPPPSLTLPPAGAQASRSDAGMARPAPPVVARQTQEAAAPAATSAAQRRTQRPPQSAEALPIGGAAGVAALPPEQQERATPTVMQTAVRPTTLWVQAGAFSSYDNANRLGSRLLSYGQPQISSVKQGAGPTLYRVRLGPVQSVPDADRLLAQVSPVAPEARIVVD